MPWSVGFVRGVGAFKLSAAKTGPMRQYYRQQERTLKITAKKGVLGTAIESQAGPVVYHGKSAQTNTRRNYVAHVAPATEVHSRRELASARIPRRANAAAA